MTKIKDLVQDWLIGGWSTSYEDDDPILPDPRSALLQDVAIKKDAIWITFGDQGRTFHKTIIMDDPEFRAKIRDALSLATGKTLHDIGEIPISRE